MNVLKEDPATSLRGTVDGLLCQAKALRRSCVGGCGVCEEWSEWVWSRVGGVGGGVCGVSGCGHSPMAIEVHCLLCCVARSSTRPLAS